MLYDLGLDLEEEEIIEQSAKVGAALLPPCPTTHRTPGIVLVAARLETLPLRLGPEPRDKLGGMMKRSKEECWAKVQNPYENMAVDDSAERKAIAAAGITCRGVT